MAFKMNPKSPALMKAMGYASPAKQTKEGGSISNTQGSDNSELTKKGATKPLTELEQAQQEANAAQLNRKIKQIRRNTAGTNKESARLEKRTARDNSGAERKQKNAKKTQERVNERKKSGKTRVGKVVAKIKKAVSPAKQSLGNKNAEKGADGKMTIISANMAKNQKPIELKKDKFKNKKMKKKKKVESPAKLDPGTIMMVANAAKELKKKK